MNGQRLLIRRTARILSASRIILAIIFLTGVLLDPDRVAHADGGIFWLLSAYLTGAMLIAMLIWRSWWWDYRLARTIHLIDIAVFIAAVLLCEAGYGYASSPFPGFSSFLLITAMARWGKRGVASTAITLVVVYGLFGGLLLVQGIAHDTYQYVRHLANIALLAMLVIWFAADMRVPRIDPMQEADGIPGQRQDQLLTAVLAFTRQIFKAGGAAIAIVDPDTQDIHLYRDCNGLFRYECLTDTGFNKDLGGDADAALFDRARQRRILDLGNGQLKALTTPFDYTMANLCQVPWGIMARLSSAQGQGFLLVWDIPVCTIDDLAVARALVREVALALDHEEMASLAQSIAVSNVRSAIARDLHDSAAQFLAGTLFRLDALRGWIRAGHNPEPEILSMRAALQDEQVHLRGLIDRLQLGLLPERTIDVVAELEALIHEMGQHWNITTSIHAPQRPLAISVDLAYELRLLLREAVANAVRHGECSQVDLAIEHLPDGVLQVSINDNGKGFATNDTQLHPRSISERIAALGGKLQIASGATGVRLDIALPAQIAA